MIVARGGGSLADLYAFCDEALCRTVALLRVPVISSVGHHTDRTLIDDVAAVCCSTPTHAAEAAVAVRLRRRAPGAARRAARAARPRPPRDRGARAGAGQLSRAPAQHVARHRGRLHQLLRELRASARRRGGRRARRRGSPRGTLERTAARAAAGDRARRARELERLALALAAHDPQRTMARGYALVAGSAGTPLGSAAAARRARELTLRFHDGAVAAEVAGEEETE